MAKRTTQPERPGPRPAAVSSKCADRLHFACSKLNCTCPCHEAEEGD